MRSLEEFEVFNPASDFDDVNFRRGPKAESVPSQIRTLPRCRRKLGGKGFGCFVCNSPLDQFKVEMGISRQGKGSGEIRRERAPGIGMGILLPARPAPRSLFEKQINH